MRSCLVLALAILTGFHSGGPSARILRAVPPSIPHAEYKVSSGWFSFNPVSDSYALPG